MRSCQQFYFHHIRQVLHAAHTWRSAMRSSNVVLTFPTAAANAADTLYHVRSAITQTSSKCNTDRYKWHLKQSGQFRLHNQQLRTCHAVFHFNNLDLVLNHRSLNKQTNNHNNNNKVSVQCKAVCEHSNNCNNTNEPQGSKLRHCSRPPRLGLS